MNRIRSLIPLVSLLSLGALGPTACVKKPSQLQEEARPRVHRFVHWNIKELDSTKIDAYEKSLAGIPSSDPSAAGKALQVAAALRVLAELKPDYLSLNEIQYDVDKAETETAAKFCDFSQVVAERRRQPIPQNDEFMLRRLPGGPWESTFCPANTGALAKRDGEAFSQRSRRLPDLPGIESSAAHAVASPHRERAPARPEVRPSLHS